MNAVKKTVGKGQRREKTKKTRDKESEREKRGSREQIGHDGGRN